MASDRIDAGKLDRRITIQFSRSTQTSFGNEKEQWFEWATVYAQQLEMLNPTEGEKDLFLVSSQFNEWVIRYKSIEKQDTPRYPNSKMRLFDVAYPDKIYDIENVEELGRRMAWKLRTKLRNG